MKRLVIILITLIFCIFAGCIVQFPVSTATNPVSTATNPVSTATNPVSTATNPVSDTTSSNGDWIWSRDHWNGWRYTSSWVGQDLGLNSEFGPAMIDDHGEYGTEIHLLDGGSTGSAVWHTFNDPSGVGWNTIEFAGMLSPPSDRPSGRWMEIDINHKQVFKGYATQNPPGNGVPFIIKRSFTQSPTVEVIISNGQNPAWDGRFLMHYYWVKLSREK